LLGEFFCVQLGAGFSVLLTIEVSGTG